MPNCVCLICAFWTWLGWISLSSAAIPLTPAAPEVAPRAQVILVKDPRASAAFNPNLGVVREMVDKGLIQVTGKRSLAEAWLSLLSTQDILGIKVWSAPGRTSGTRPEVVAALIAGLIEAGFPRGQIVIWDKRSDDLRAAGFFDFESRFGVQVASSAAFGYDTNAFYDSPLLGNLIYGDVEFGQKGPSLGRKSYLTKLLSQKLTRIVQVTPLLNHHQAGVCGNLYGLATGAAENVLRFESDAGRLAEAIPEIYALPLLGDRVVLNIVDALLCQYEGGPSGMLHYSVVLNELRFSTDPVALDLLSIDELDRQRKLARVIPLKRNLELYHNASLLEIGLSDRSRIQVVQVP